MWEGLSHSPSVSLSSFLDQARRFLKLQFPESLFGLSMKAAIILIRSFFSLISILKDLFKASAITIWPTRYMQPQPTSDYMLLSSNLMLSLYENQITLLYKMRNSQRSLGRSRSKCFPRIQTCPWRETWSVQALNLQVMLVPILVSYLNIITNNVDSIISLMLFRINRALFISTKTTPNPNSLKFHPGKPLLPFTHDFPTIRHTQASPLARELFMISGVNRVFFGTDHITVSKQQKTEWTVLKPQIFNAITKHLTSGEPIMTDKKERALLIS